MRALPVEIIAAAALRLSMRPSTRSGPVSMTRLRKGLDEFLERDQDRALFDLPPRPKDA